MGSQVASDPIARPGILYATALPQTNPAEAFSWGDGALHNGYAAAPGGDAVRNDRSARYFPAWARVSGFRPGFITVA
jgi:hypothetical protein